MLHKFKQDTYHSRKLNDFGKKFIILLKEYHHKIFMCTKMLGTYNKF